MLKLHLRGTFYTSQNADEPNSNPSYHRQTVVKIISSHLSAVGLAVVQHPSKQINLGHDSQRLQRTALVLLGDHSGTVPLEEAVQHAEGSLQGDLHELTTGTGASRPAESAGIGDNLRDLGEVKHDL